LRRRSESNDVFAGCQPQYPDLQAHFNIDFKGLQTVFGTTRHLPDLTRRLYPAYSVIEEIIEGFVEGFLTELVICFIRIQDWVSTDSISDLLRVLAG
jgi:hypothetical protein